MLGLKLPSDPRWVNIAEKNLNEILSDHAFCEQKAASTAISLIVSFREPTALRVASRTTKDARVSDYTTRHNI